MGDVINTIWKYPIEAVNEIQMPKDAEILSVGYDPQSQLCVWANVYPDRPVVTRVIKVFGTGKAINIPGNHLWFIGTVKNGPFMWHVYEITGGW